MIVKKVRNIFSAKNDGLKYYKNRLWDNIKYFDSFSIKVILRDQNSREESLVVPTSLILPHPDF